MESSVGSVSPYFMIREPIYLTLNDVVVCSHVIRRERGLATAIVYPRCPCRTGTTAVPPLKGTAYLIYARQMRAYCSLFSCAAANAFTSIKHYNNKSILKLDILLRIQCILCLLLSAPDGQYQYYCIYSYIIKLSNYNFDKHLQF